MLYDPKWEKKADPLSLESLIAWLEKQQPYQSYEYCDSARCLIAQWLKATGAEKFDLGADEISAMFDGRGDDVVMGMNRNTAWTFGSALERARSLTSA